jgi:cytochrome c oxidase assembly protein subunit 15
VGRLRLSPDRYRRLCRAALVALVGIVVTGAAVRLTGSGLGCTDWPTCSDERLVAPLELAPMIEFVNRLITGVVSVAVIAAVAGALARVPRRADLIWLAAGLVVGVVAQILLGAALVLTDLDPRFTIGHFLLSAVLVGNAVVLVHRAGREPGPAAAGSRGSAAGGADPLMAPAPVAARRLAAALAVLGAAVLVTGTVVTGAGPHGGDDRAARLNLDVADVARTHSLVVWTFLALAVALALVLARTDAGGHRLRVVRRLLALTVAQGALGYLQYVLAVPPLLVGLHVLGATLVWAATVQASLVILGPGVAVAQHRIDAERRRGEVPVLSVQ